MKKMQRMEKNSICCVGVIEVVVASAKDKENRWTLSMGFGSEQYTEEHGEALKKKALSLTRQAVKRHPERYGFAASEKIEYKTSINVMGCNALIGAARNDND